jgi:hypothetical protein
MKLGLAIGITILSSGCTLPDRAHDVVNSDPPEEWSIASINQGGCPNVSGEFTLIPKVAVLQSSGQWEISLGDWYDYVLLMPLDRAEISKKKLSDYSDKHSKNSLVFMTYIQEGRVEIVAPNYDGDVSISHVLKRENGDFSCEEGGLVFPEFRIKGGTEGGTLSGTIRRIANETKAGDLLFYERIDGKKVTQRYYLFKKSPNPPALQ